MMVVVHISGWMNERIIERMNEWMEQSKFNGSYPLAYIDAFSAQVSNYYVPSLVGKPPDLAQKRLL